MKRSSIAFFVALAFSNAAMAVSTSELPTKGKVVVGSGSINQSGNVLTVNQDSGKLAINWATFNIGVNSTVNFVQPSADAIALNRVIGSDVSVIQGKLNANGNVFLINPNGILFTPTAQVNVGGLLASTLNISNKNFMNGNFTFSGKSSNAIINQGNIISTGYGVSMIAAKITNNGTIVASNGGDVLLGAGETVTLDLGGPVKLQVKKSVIDALIDNGGVIRANGGTVYLTALAANKLATTVINNTGLIEAQTLATGEKGEIHLVGDMQNDHILVDGKLDVSAPSGGDEGTITIDAASVEYTDAADISLNAINEIAATAQKAADAANAKVAAAEQTIAAANAAVEKAKAQAEAKIAAAKEAAENARAVADAATKNAEALAEAAKKDPTNKTLAKEAKKAANNATAKAKTAKAKDNALVKTIAAVEKAVAVAEKNAAKKIASAEKIRIAAETAAAPINKNAAAAQAKAASVAKKVAAEKATTPASSDQQQPLSPIADAQKGTSAPSNVRIASSIKFQNILDTPTAAGGEEEVTEQTANNELIINYLGDGINLPE
jgi:filamentous hemagglutinin family protein